MSKEVAKEDITVEEDVDIIALVTEYGYRFPLLQWGFWSSNKSGTRYLTAFTPIRDVSVLERVLSELVTKDKVDLVIKDFLESPQTQRY